ncbi:MAG: hypothetical protein PHS96_12995 [Anaerolineales bacterium]|nr:hypothetical protein [Anaerolineales bacterium]
MALIFLFSAIAPRGARGASNLSPLAVGGGPFLWTIEFVESNHDFYNMGPRSLAREPGTNNLHLAYGGDQLYHAYFNGTTWSVEVVDSSPWVGQYASVAINSYIHIAYYDAYNGQLKYARRPVSGGAWTITVVDVPMMAAMNANGDLEAASSQLTPPEPKSPPKPWSEPQLWQDVLPPLDSGLQAEASADLQPDGSLSSQAMSYYYDEPWGVGGYTAIDLTNSGYVYISYYDAINQKLKLAIFNGLAWSTTWVTQSFTSFREGKYTAIEAFTDQDVHIAFLEDDHDDLRYAHWNGIRWRYYTIADGDPGRNMGGYNSIARDNDGKIHIAFYDKSGGSLRYVNQRRPSGIDYEDWNPIVTVKDGTNGSGAGLYASLRLDSNNKPFISYYDSDARSLKYAYNTSGTWVIKNVSSPENDETEGTIGLFTSLVFDSAGKPHISYVDTVLGELREAYGSAKTNPIWSFRKIDDNKDVGLSTSLAIDNADIPHISYMNDTSNDLKHATNPGGGWVTEVVTATGNVGIYSSIDTDAAGNPRIAYYAPDRGDLRYAIWSAGTWTHETVDMGGLVQEDSNDVGSRPSLFISSDVPYITYFDATDKDLKIAIKSGASWAPQAVVWQGDSGRYSSLALDGSGNIYISYYQETNEQSPPVASYDLMFLYSNSGGATWYKAKVDGADLDIGKFNSIALDTFSDPGNVHPVIAYYDDTNNDLRYARGAFNGSDWVFTTEVVDDGGFSNWDVGQYASIDVDSTGVPFICYYDATNTALKVANKTGGTWYKQMIDYVGDVGRYCSLEIDSLDIPHISYYDATNGELKYARDPLPMDSVYLPVILR